MRDERTVLLSPDEVLEYVPPGTHHPSTDLHGGEEGEELASETETSVFEDVPDDDDTFPVLEGGGKTSRTPKKETALERWRRRRCRRPERCNNLVNVMQLKLTGPTRARCGKNKTRRRRSRTKRGGTPRGRRTPSPSRRAGDDGLFSSIIKSAMGGATLPTLLKQAGGVVLFELLGLLMQGSKSDLLRAIGRTITVDAFTNLISGAITSFSPQNQRTTLKRVVDASIRKHGSDNDYAVRVTNLFEVISKKLNGTQFEFTQLAMPMLALENVVDTPDSINGTILSCMYNLMFELSQRNGNGGTRAVFPPEVFLIFELIADKEEEGVDINFINNQKKGAGEPQGAAPSAPRSEQSSFQGQGQRLGSDASPAPSASPPPSFLPPVLAPCEQCVQLRGYVAQLSAMVDFLLTNVKEEQA
jgi:hypothetical protein